jgi:hypothetical protein
MLYNIYSVIFFKFVYCLSNIDVERVTPNNTAFITSMLGFAKSNQWNKIYLVSGADPFDIDVAETINELKEDYGIDVVEHLVFVATKYVIDGVKKLRIDGSRADEIS